MNAILKLILYCVQMNDCVCGNVLDCHCQRTEGLCSLLAWESWHEMYHLRNYSLRL